MRRIFQLVLRQAPTFIQTMARILTAAIAAKIKEIGLVKKISELPQLSTEKPCLFGDPAFSFETTLLVSHEGYQLIWYDHHDHTKNILVPVFQCWVFVNNFL